MRKKLLVLMSVLLLVGCYYLINQLQNSNFTLFNDVSVTETEHIRASLEKAEQLEFTALLCNEMRVPFDQPTKTFFVPVDMKSERWETMDFMSGQPEYQILFEEDLTKNRKQDVLAANQNFSLLVYDENRWSEYYVVFTGLPIIDLATEEGFFLEQIWGTATFYDTNFLNNGIKKSDYNGHIRGNTSRMFPKKGYKLNLTEKDAQGDNVLNKQALFGMREDDDWILHALYNDDTKIRDMLSMKVWEGLGAYPLDSKSHYGPKMIYVELFADNVYQGLYGLMEPVDAKQLNLQEEDYLYKREDSDGLNWEKFAQAAADEEHVCGFEIKSGILDDNAWKAMEELARILHEPDETYRENVKEALDIDSAIRMWTFMQIITGHDHTAKNVFYVAKQQEMGWKFYFAPWDMDLTWGNVSVGETNPWYTAFEYDTVDNRVKWSTADRLIENNLYGAKDQMQELYAELRKTTLTDENVRAMIQELDDQIQDSGAFARDKLRWPEGLHASSTEVLTNYALERLDFLDKALYNFSCFDD